MASRERSRGGGLRIRGDCGVQKRTGPGKDYAEARHDKTVGVSPQFKEFSDGGGGEEHETRSRLPA